MPVLQNILLGTIFGYFLAFARVESLWWPHLGSSAEALKSKVPATARGNSIAFYRSMNDSTYNLDYFLLASVILLLLSFVGQIVQFPQKRLAAFASLVCFSIGTIFEIGFARPLILSLKSKATSGNLIEKLFNISYYHAIVFGSLLVTVLIQTSTEVDTEEEQETPAKKSKSKKEVKVE